MTALLDWRGTPIEVGSIILYPGRHSSYQWMNEAKVLEINTVTKWSREWHELKVERLNNNTWSKVGDDRRFVTLSALKNVTVIREGRT